MLKRVETIAFVSIVVVAVVLGFVKLMPAQSSAAQQLMSLTPSPEPTELPTDVPTDVPNPTATPRPTDVPLPTSTPSDGATATPRPTRQPFELTATPVDLTATPTTLPTATVLFSEVVTRFTHLVHIPLPPCAESCGCPRRNAAPTDGERQPGALWLSQILTADDAGDRGYAHPHPVPQHTTGR